MSNVTSFSVAIVVTPVVPSFVNSIFVPALNLSAAISPIVALFKVIVTSCPFRLPLLVVSIFNPASPATLITPSKVEPSQMLSYFNLS